jgi:hypothetical protein
VTSTPSLSSSASSSAADTSSSSSAVPGRKAVGSGPPGGSAGRLGLRQSSGFRAATTWAGVGLVDIDNWSAGTEATRSVLCALGNDGAIWTVPDPVTMLPTTLAK